MSKTFKDAPGSRQIRSGPGRGRQRNISVRAVRRDPPDLQRLSRALIQLALAEAEAEAAAQAQAVDENSDNNATAAAPPADEEPHD
jgi:hypothetical protein